jgi:hypothetical protein
MTEMKNISLKLREDEWVEIEENYLAWLTEHRIPISRHAWMKQMLINLPYTFGDDK